MTKAIRRPYKIDWQLTEAFRNTLEAMGWYPTMTGYEVYVTDTRCGRCSYRGKNITIPVWAFENPMASDRDYCLYYFYHELTHSIVGKLRGAPHGAKFMETFMKICPKELQWHEIGYKPRNAKAAGISKND